MPSRPPGPGVDKFADIFALLRTVDEVLLFFLRLLECAFTPWTYKMMPPCAGVNCSINRRHILLHGAQTLGFHRHQLMSFFFLMKSCWVTTYGLMILLYPIAFHFYITIRKTIARAKHLFPFGFRAHILYKKKIIKKKKHSTYINFVRLTLNTKHLY